MKNTKKVLSVALAGALAFGSMGAAFAAAPVMDAKTDKQITEAVERLSAFGIVAGMEDGKYHEEMKVTREQFAKILVEALGLGNAADAAKGSTKFSDVESSRWSAGYINVAAGQGLLKGYEDGTFKPAAEVSYAEAVTMLVRALGYKDEFLRGTWPGNYVSKAADTGITNGAKFTDATGKADRGIVAVLVDNALDAKVVKVKEYEGDSVKFEESDRTLLKDKLDINKYENVRIIAEKTVDDSLEANEVNVRFLKDMDDEDLENVKNEYSEGEEKVFDLANNANVKNVLGQEVTLFLNDNNEVVYAINENDDKVEFDYVEGAPNTKEISLVKFDDDYKFAKDATVYLFDGKDSYSKIDGEDVVTEDLLGKPGRFIVKNNEIVFAEVLNPNEGTPWIAVTENKDGVIKGINQSDEEFSLDLSKDGNYDGVVAYDKAGNKIEVKDIAAGNILYVQKQDWEGDDYAVVTVITDNVVKGKLGKVKDDRVEIEGKEIKVTRFDKGSDRTYDAFYSVDDNDNSDQWKSGDWEDDMEDADGTEIVGYLDGAGRIAYLTTAAEASSGYKYGVVTQTYADNDRVKVYTMTEAGKGDEITYNAEESKNLKTPIKVDQYGHAEQSAGKDVLWDIPAGKTSALREGSVVKFKLNKDGEIAEDEMFMMDEKNYFVMNPADGGKDFGKDSIPSKLNSDTATKSFNVENDVVLVDAPGLGVNGNIGADVEPDDDFGIVKWEELADDNYSPTLKYYVFTDDDNDIDAKGIVFVDTGASTGDDAESIYVIDKWSKGGDYYVKYADEDGKIEEKELSNSDSDAKDFKDEHPYIAEVKSDGKIELYKTDSKEDYDRVAGVVKKKDGDVITVTVNGTDQVYKFASNTVVYEEDVKKSKSNIAKGDAVRLIVENDSTIRIAERLIDSEKTAVAGGGTETPTGDTSLVSPTTEGATVKGLVYVEGNLAKNTYQLKLTNKDTNKVTYATKELLKGETEVSFTYPKVDLGVYKIELYRENLKTLVKSLGEIFLNNK